ncbi:MAG: hypothetical protein F4Y74_11855 [Gemmatimonadales bacterium]|nr:hypothetical protein [Gemmatimonadales bacterium]
MSQEQGQHSTEADEDRFVNLVNGSDFWQSIDLRICAIRHGRRWVNLVTRGFLDHRAPPSVPEFSTVDRQDFRAWQVVLPITDLPGVVHGMVSGAAKLGPSSVQYVDGSGQPAMKMRYVFSELAASYRRAEYDLWSCHALVGYGSSMWDVVKQAIPDPLELDNIIRSGANAFDGLSDLVRRFCARPQALGVRPEALSEVQNKVTTIDLIAPLAVSLDRGKVAASSDHVSVALRAADGVFVAKAELVWTLATTGEPPRHESVRLGKRDWAEGGGALHSQLDVPIQKGDVTATLFVLVEDRCVDCMSMPLAETGSNVRIKAHGAFDPGLRRFQEQLRPVRLEKGTEFEAAVGQLFFFLGFHVDPLSAPKRLQDAADHLAHAAESSVVLVIECTVGPPDGGGKLGKLIARSENVRSQLPGGEVIAVLATARPREALPKAEVEKAARDDVALLAREDLDELWTAAQTGETAAHVVRRLRNQLIQARFRRARRSSG